MLTRRARRVYHLKRAGTSRQARPRLTLMHDKGVLGINIVMLGEQVMKIKEIH